MIQGVQTYRSSTSRRTQVPSSRLAAQTARLMEQTIDYVDSRDFRSVSREELLREPEITQSNITPPAGTLPYLAALYEFPLLTREQEFQIFRKMNYLRFEAARLQRKLSLSALNSQAVRRIQQLLRESAEVRNRIVQSNLRLVVSIAKTMTAGGESIDDLISEGNIPLIRAAEIFDFNRGLRFSTYATWAIRNGLYRVIKRKRRRQQRLGELEPAWSQELAESPVLDEYSFTQPQVDQCIRRLDDRGQTIIQDRFGLSGKNPPAKFRELAEKLNLSSERVRQLLARALKELKEMLGES